MPFLELLILLMAISVLHSNMENKLIVSYALDLNLTHMVSALHQGFIIPNFSLHNGLLKRKAKLVIRPNDTLKTPILQWMHNSAQGGHSGRDAILQKGETCFLLEGYGKICHPFC